MCTGISQENSSAKLSLLSWRLRPGFASDLADKLIRGRRRRHRRSSSFLRKRTRGRPAWELRAAAVADANLTRHFEGGRHRLAFYLAAVFQDVDRIFRSDQKERSLLMYVLWTTV